MTKTTLVCKMPCWASLVAYSRFILHSAAQHSHPLQCWSEWELNIPHNPPLLPQHPPPATLPEHRHSQISTDALRQTAPSPLPPFLFFFSSFWWEVAICSSNIWASHKSGPQVSTYWSSFLNLHTLSQQLYWITKKFLMHSIIKKKYFQCACSSCSLLGKSNSCQMMTSQPTERYKGSMSVIYWRLL